MTVVVLVERTLLFLRWTADALTNTICVSSLLFPLLVPILNFRMMLESRSLDREVLDLFF